MTQLIFQREMLIDAPLAQVWQLVATEDGLRQWWGNPISLEPKEGGRCEEWRRHRGKSLHWQGIVTTYAPPHHLTMTLQAHEAQGDWPQLTTISIALDTADRQTRVHVMQRAFEAAPVIGTAGEPHPTPQPAKPIHSPLAQLDRLPPGSVPMPAPIHAPQTGRAEPAHLLVAHEQLDDLTLWWQRRLTNLAAATLTAP